MVKDAELNAADDHKKLELVQARNHADAMVHSVRKSLADHGKDLSDEEKSKIEEAVKEVEEALKSDDKATIEAKTDAMMAASHKLSEKMYADVQKAAAAQGETAGEAQAISPQGRYCARRQRRRCRVQGSQEVMSRPARDRAAVMSRRVRASTPCVRLNAAFYRLLY